MMNEPIERRRFLKLTALAGSTVIALASGATALAGCSSGSSSVSGSDAEKLPVPSDAGSAAKANGLLASFALISDLHLAPDTAQSTMFSQTLADIAAYEQRPDAILVAGDIADHGLTAEFDVFKSVVAESSFDLSDFIVTIGNHEQFETDDPGEPDEDSEDYTAEHLAFKRGLFTSAFDLESLSYDKHVAGQHVVMLGPDNLDNIANFSFSDELVDWLEEMLDEDARLGVRTIVVTHEPIPGVSPSASSRQWGYYNSMVDYDRLLDVVLAHPRAIFVSGHTHLQPGVYAVEGGDGTPCGPIFVNEGAIGRGIIDVEDYEAGRFISMSVLLDIYKDRLYLRFRKHTDQTWFLDPVEIQIA